MRTLALRAVALAIALAAAPQTSFAQSKDDAKAQSLERYNRGKTHYDLGRFDEAIDEFQKAYELDQNPVYLFNIAQAYRQKGENQRAIFFYKRFLSADPDNPKRDSVEKRIKELEDLIKKGQEVKDKPPESVGNPDDKGRTGTTGTGTGTTTTGGGTTTTGGTTAAVTTTTAGTTGGTGESEGGDVAMTNPDAGEDSGEAGSAVAGEAEEGTGVSAKAEHARPIRLTAEGGVALVRFTDPQLAASGLLSFLVGGAYTIPLADAMRLDVGAVGTFVAVPWDVGAVKGNSSLISAVATGTFRYSVIPDLDIRVEAGAGILWFAGLGEGNPFTENGLAASGPLGMFHVRAALGADYELGGGLVITATVPAFSWSPPNASLKAEIKSVVRFDFLVGLTYAL